MKRWFAVITIACTVFLTIHAANYLLDDFAVKGTKEFIPVESFQYINSIKKSDIKNGDSLWTAVDESSGITYDKDEKYTLIRMGVKVDEYYNALCIKTDNSVLRVECDGKQLFKNRGERSYSDHRIEIIKLPETGKEQIVEILVYSPYTFRFNAFMTNYKGSAGNVSFLKYVDVIGGGVMLVSALVLLSLFLTLYGRERIKFKELYIPFILLLGGLILLFNPPFSIVNGGRFASFKLSVTLSALLFVFVLLKNILDKVYSDSFVEALGGVNIIYVMAIALSPYDLMFSVLVKMFPLLIAVDIMSYMYIHAKNNLSSFDIIKESAFATFIICAFMYWFSLSQRLNMDFSIYMIISSLVCALALLYVFRVNKGNIISGSKTKKRATNQELLKKIPFNEILIVKKYALPLTEKIRDIKIPDESAVTVFEGLENIFKFEGDFSDILNFKLNNDIHHLIKVGEYSRIIALAMGYSTKRAIIIGKAALLHDIGKLAVDYNVLTKQGILSEEEFAAIKLHTEFGFEILSGKKDEFFKMAAVIARDHHERFDGTGYNHMQSGERSIESRIVAVADVFDAMSSRRIYKKSWGFENVFNYILEHGGDLFDPKIIEQFKLARNDLAACYYAYHKNEPEALQMGVQ